MLGILNTSLKGHESRGPIEAMALAQSHGLDGILYDFFLEVFPDLSAPILEQVRDEGKARGMQVAAALGFFNPANPKRCTQLLALGEGDVVKGLLAAIGGAERVGCETMFFMIGKIEDREDQHIPWQRQLDGVVDALQPIRQRLRDSSVRLLLKTHEEMSTEEGLRIVEAVGGDALGISLDPANVVCRLENPVLAARRVAPYLRQVHLDDAFTTFDGPLLRRYLQPMGSGDIDWDGVLDVAGDVPVWIEWHRGQFAMPVFDADWLAAQPDLTRDEYRDALGKAFDRYLHAAVPSDQQAEFDRLQPAIDWIRQRTPR